MNKTFQTLPLAVGDTHTQSLSLALQSCLMELSFLACLKVGLCWIYFQLAGSCFFFFFIHRIKQNTEWAQFWNLRKKILLPQWEERSSSLYCCFATQIIGHFGDNFIFHFATHTTTWRTVNKKYRNTNGCVLHGVQHWQPAFDSTSTHLCKQTSNRQVREAQWNQNNNK